MIQSFLSSGVLQGVSRVAQSLHSHTWPGMQLKPHERALGDGRGALGNGRGEALAESVETASPSSSPSPSGGDDRDVAAERKIEDFEKMLGEIQGGVLNPILFLS